MSIRSRRGQGRDHTGKNTFKRKNKINRRLHIKRSYLKKYNFSGEPKNIFKGSLSNEFVIFQNVVTPGVRTIKP